MSDRFRLRFGARRCASASLRYALLSALAPLPASRPQTEANVFSPMLRRITRNSKLNPFVTHRRQKASSSTRDFRVGQTPKETELRWRPSFRWTDKTHFGFCPSSRANTRYASLQLLRYFSITHRAQQCFLGSRPAPRTFPALRDAQRISFQLYRHHRVWSLAEQFNLPV